MPATHLDEFKTFLSETEFENLEIKYQGDNIILNKLPFSKNIVTLSAFSVLLIFMMRMRYVQSPPDIITVQAMGILLFILLIFLWVYFNAVNRVAINWATKTIIVRSKNVIKLIFTGIKKYPFADVANVPVEAGIATRFKRYRVYIHLKSTDTGILLLDFNREAQATAIARQLQSLIKSNG